MSLKSTDPTNARLEARLRDGFGAARLPIESEALAMSVARVPDTPPAQETDRRHPRFALLVAAGIALAAGLAVMTGAGRVSIVTPTPSASIGTASPIPSVSNAGIDWLAPDGVARAVAFRKSAGLQADVAWVVAVAVDPGAQSGISRYSVPLLPSEIQTLDARATTTRDILRAIAPYGAAHRDAWAGDYVDPARGVVVVRFTKDLETHAAAIRALVNPNAPVEIRPATYTLAALEDLKDRVGIDTGWLHAHGFDIWGVGADAMANKLLVQVSTRLADAGDVLEEHYSAPGMLEIESDGTGVRLMPTGTLKGHVTDHGGRPLSGVEVILVGDIAGAGPGGDIGHETAASGAFLFPDITAVGYEIRLYRDTSGERVLVGHIHVTVRPGKVTNVTVEADG